MSHYEKMPLSKIWIICRVCLQQQEKLFHLFDEIFNKNIWLYLRDCGGVPVRRNDDLPDKICEACLQRLNKAINFRIDCQRSHDELVQMRINRDAMMDEGDFEDESKTISYISDDIPPSNSNSLVNFEPEIFTHHKEKHENLATATSDNKSIKCESNDRSNKEYFIIKDNDKKENNLEKINKSHGRKPIVMLLKLKKIPHATNDIETKKTEPIKTTSKF